MPDTDAASPASLHTVGAYVRELRKLIVDLLSMGHQVEKLITMAIDSFGSLRPELPVEADILDKGINALEDRIEQQATLLLALRNPMAVDLRLVTAALKMSTIFERMGDIAKKIASRSAHLGHYRPERAMQQLRDMAQLVLGMLAVVLESISRVDPEKVEDVLQKDKEVNDLYHTVFTEVQKAMLSDPEHAEAFTHIIFLAKNLERRGDYTTNLGKSVRYIALGKRRLN